MNRLDDFLSLPNIIDVIEEVYINERLGKIKIKPMTVEQHRSYQNRCKGKIKESGSSFDFGKFTMLIVLNHVIEPNFNDKEFLDRTDFKIPQDFIEAKIYPGELQDMSRAILKISGFDFDGEDKEQDLIDEAKN